jgi:hypothetical protein
VFNSELTFLAGACTRNVCKVFHTVEELFRFALVGSLLRRGVWNFNPSRWQWSPFVTRTNLARMACFVPVIFFIRCTGEEGISIMIFEPSGRKRCMASNAPPQLMSNAVANSMNSRPLGSKPRTKTGMARGSLSHFLLSEPRLDRPMPTVTTASRLPRREKLFYIDNKRVKSRHSVRIHSFPSNRVQGFAAMCNEKATL